MTDSDLVTIESFLIVITAPAWFACFGVMFLVGGWSDWRAGR